MNDYLIVTSADESYSEFVRNLAENCLRIFGQKPIIYDLGISEETKKNIDAEFIAFKTSSQYKSLNSINCIKATHKPKCILDFFYNSNKKFLFIDADCLFTKKPKFPDSDICLTFRIYSEQTVSDFSKNGIINSGVIFIDPTTENAESLEKLIKEWISICEKNDDTTDQKALSDILIQLNKNIHPQKTYRYLNASVSILESEKFNDVKRKTGDILHFKSASRRKDKMKEYKIFCKILNYNIFTYIYIYFNRFILKAKKLTNKKRYKERYIHSLTNTHKIISSNTSTKDSTS